MKRIYRSIVQFLLCLFFLSSCNTGIDLGAIDDTSIQIDESLVLPIGEANMTIKDVLNKIGLPSGVDTVSNEIILEWNFKDSIEINELNLADSVKPFSQDYLIANYIPPAFIGVLIQPNNVVPTIKIDDVFELGVNYNLASQRVDSIRVNSSDLAVNFDVSDDLKSLPASDFNIEFLFSDQYLKIDGGIIPTYKPVQYNVPGNLSIGKYSMYLLNGMRTLPYSIVIHLNPSLPITLSASSFVKISVEFTKIDYKVAYGKFNIREINQKSINLPFKIEDYLTDAAIQFSDPKVKIRATSNVGADLDVVADYLMAYNSTTPANKVWAWFDNHTSNSKKEYIPGPATYGAVSTVDFDEFNSTNGEIEHMFDYYPYPNVIDYMYSIKSRPTRKLDFVSPDSRIDLGINVQIPLKIKSASPYAVSDTIKDFDTGNVFEKIDSAVLVLKLRNGLPLKAAYRMTFCKSDLPGDTIPAVGGFISKITNASSLGNMTSEYNLISPKVDANGDIADIVPQTIQIMLDKTQIEALKQTKFIIYHVLLDTDKSIVGGVETSNPCHITTKNGFGVNLGVFVKGSVKADLKTANQ